MSKIVIYGLGKIFNDYAKNVNLEEVVCFSDASFSLQYQFIFGKICIPPNRIIQYDFDYVVIFVNRETRQIYKNLISSGIPAQKIISWQYYLYNVCNSVSSFAPSVCEYIEKFIEERHITSILDIGSGAAKAGLISSSSVLSNRIKKIDLLSDKTLYARSMYDGIITDVSHYYDALTCLDYYVNHSVCEAAELFDKLADDAKYIILTIPYPYPEDYREWAEFDFTVFGEVQEIRARFIHLLFIQRKNINLNRNVRIFAAVHKKFSIPESDCIVPIFSGKSSQNEFKIQGDAEGDSIAELNHLINESTSIYWIWKNTDIKYVGVCHYRRFFGYDKPLVASEIIGYLRNADMIVTNPVHFFPLTIKTQLKSTVLPEAFEKGFNLVRKIIMEKYPEYIEDFDAYFNTSYFYSCNMFIAKKELFDRYCSWIFSIILPACKKFDGSGYDGYSKRIIGFMMERLLTLWIIHNGITVKQVPMIITENIVLDKS